MPATALYEQLRIVALRHEELGRPKKYIFFFFLLSSAALSRLLGPSQLMPGVRMGPTAVALGGAAVLWAGSLWSAWRHSHGP